ncbi:MAG: GNAT family N-acetyltransferase [Treponema sp.]|nr:GNAT family N-acetyltransferase [Treponema sp.]
MFDDPYLIGQYYAAPYMFFDRDTCFIAEENSIPSGYVVCAVDTLKFKQWMAKEWLPSLALRYTGVTKAPKTKLESLMRGRICGSISDNESQTPHYADYPAHLHIDLLPSLQGKGQGKALIEALFSSLKGKTSGVHLLVNLDNERAVGFYQKVGFTVLQEFIFGYIMGRKV